MMVNDVFNIENFDCFSDNDNYYFFRALNKGDNSDIDNSITVLESGKIVSVRTDRERCIGETKYKDTSKLSLEEMFDHIKMHHRTDTNCISLSTNANVVLLYGREYYKDKYVMVKIPKNELGSKVINAGLYLINEINSKIDLLLQTNQLSEKIKYYLDKIDNVKNKEELNYITEQLRIDEDDITDKYFEKGIEYSSKDINTVDYQALNSEQNLEKDKIVAKLNVLGINILPKVSNKFLIQTIGNAFSSLEFIHYNNIPEDKLIELPKEMVDIFAVLQQMPRDYPMLNELKLDLLKIINDGNFKTEEFNYHNIKLDTENDYTIDKMYYLTNGDVDYKSAINLYKKSFYLAKSKLRTISLINNLENILGSNTKYVDILNYLKNNTYAVEPKIFSCINSNKLKVSESVNLDFSTKELELFNFINKLDINNLDYIINKPMDALKNYLSTCKSIEKRYMSRVEYYANAIIDLFDWSKIDVVKFNQKRKNDLINKLISNNVIEYYNYLKEYDIKEKSIANVLLTLIIKEKEFDRNNFIRVYELFRKYKFYFIDDIILNYLEIFTLDPLIVENKILELIDNLGNKYIYIIGSDIRYLENIIE